MLQAVRLLSEMARTSDDRSRGDNESNSDMQASASNNEASVLFREIHKNGWLRRTDSTTAKPDRNELPRYWVTFCVHDDAEPMLEGFAHQKQAGSHSPLWSYSLRDAQHLSPTLCATSKNDYEFCVSFSDDRVLRLAAPSYQSMLDWVQVVTRKLTDMKVLRPKENLYSRGPERIATRDPTSPLPPPPSLGLRIVRALNSASPSTSSAPTVFTFDDIANEERARPGTRQQQSPAAQQQQQQQPQPTRSAPPVPVSPRLPGGSVSVGNSHGEAPGDTSYESVFLAQSGDPGSRTSSNATGSRSHQNSSDESDQYAALIEYRSSDNPESAGAGATATVAFANPVATAVVHASHQSRPHQTRTQLTLREQQVLQLRKEMSHPAGVRLKLGRRDCKDGIAFVDCFGAVWIAGWKHKEHPLLYNVLHIGDLVLSVAGFSLNGASSVREILKVYTSPRVEIIVRRLPHGRVTTLTRRSETEDFGLNVGPLNEVLAVSQSAQDSGLPALASPADPGAEAGSTIKWTLTEVNNRPLGLYEGNGRERLNAIGRDVSVVLQPADLISAIRKKLRAVRSYKSFVLP